jgi:signal transduction histidine kinase/HAMP domain-containing protein
MEFLTNLTLWKKITLLTTIGLLLGVGAFSSLGMRAVNQATEAMLQDRLTTARLVADYVDEALGRALTELKNTAQSIESDGAKNNLEPQIEALEDTYSRLSIDTHGIYLLNEEGQLIWSKPETARLASINISAYPSISHAMTTGEASVSGLILAPLTDAPVVFLASPTKIGREGDKDVLIVAIDLARSSIGGFVQPIRLGKTGYVEIVDQNGIVVARTEPGPKLAPFEKSDHSGRFATLISAGEPTRGMCHTCHEAEQKVERKDVLAFVPLSNARWGVVIRQSEEEALAPASELRQSLLLFGAGVVTVALLFVVITTQDVGTRIKMLTSASRRIAEGDLISPVTTSGRDEVGILAQTFDNMRVKLKASYGELEQRTKELSALLSVSGILTSTLDLSGLLDAVVAKAVEIISGADGGALLLERVDRGGLVVQSAVGLDKGSLSKFVFSPNGEPGSNWISEPVDEGRKDIVEEAVTAFLQSDALRSSAQSSICAEVFHRNRHIGSLIMISFHDAQAFSESDRRLLQAIADDIAIAIERVELTKEADEARALHEADRLRSQFISSVSHELRTPLTLIKGYSTSLLRQDVSWDEETQQEFLQTIDEKTDELRDLIDKLLQSAKLEAGALKLEKEPLLISRLTERVVEEMAPRTKRHRLTLKFPPHFPVIEADVRCMEQVLRNLVENAIKYSPEGGEVVIAGEVEDGKVIVSVSDEGVGIPPEHQDKVFERFYRVVSPLMHSTSGSGLGLSITKGHVEAHGGEVWLESTADKGSKFYFSLPIGQIEDTKEDREEGQ